MFRVRAGDHDEKANRISSYPYMIVEQRDQQEQWVDFGAYNYDSGAMHDGHKLGPGKHQRILIELPSNVPQHILQAHRECRTGKKPFCSAGYVGMEPGLALRQDSAGGYYHTECEPSKCALFLNSEEPRSKAKEIFEDWHTTYGYANLDTMVYDKQAGGKVKAGAACKPLVYFLFHLVDPNDHSRLLHPPTEFAHFQTRSHVNLGNWTKKLHEVWALTGGRPAGFRLYLIYQGFTNQWDKWVHGWNLETPSDTEFHSQLEAARERRRYMDGDLLTGTESRELAVISEERLVTDLASNQSAAIGDALDRAYAYEVFHSRVSREQAQLVTDHPVVQAFARRLAVNYALFTSWPARFKDPFLLVQALAKQCSGKGLPFVDLLRGTDFEGLIVMEPSKPAEIPASVAQVAQEEAKAETVTVQPQTTISEPDEADMTMDVRGGSGIVDAEYEEVEDEPGEFVVPTEDEVREWNEKREGGKS